MTSWLRVCILFCLLIGLTACGQSEAPQSDFAILASADDAYTSASPGTRLEFPRDHGAHPDYRIEWWYQTASLEAQDGRLYGAQWTLFRVATTPADASADSQIYMAHFGLSWPDGHRGWQRYARGSSNDEMSRTGVGINPFIAWLDDWELAGSSQQLTPMRVKARQDNYSLNLRLSSSKDIVLQGDNGFSQKHPNGGGSFYYSHPFLLAEGTIEIEGKLVQVTGRAWLDHEWSSQFLQADQAGWDWFSLHLDSGEKLMLFQLRGKQKSLANYQHGVLIHPNGDSTVIDPDQITLQALKNHPVYGRQLPLEWRILLPGLGRNIHLRPLHSNQWMDLDFPYWEGVVIATGEGAHNSGRGFMELTGYPKD